jgi:hypothetical protein
MRRAQLGEPAASTPGRPSVLDGVGEQFDDVIVRPEVGEVLEREVDRAEDRAAAAELTELVQLSLSAGHAARVGW